MQNTRKISNIYSHRDAMREATQRFRTGLGAGGGRPWDGVPGGAMQVLDARSPAEVDVYRLRDGSEIAVGHANGVRAVTVTPAPRTGR